MISGGFSPISTVSIETPFCVLINIHNHNSSVEISSKRNIARLWAKSTSYEKIVVVITGLAFEQNQEPIIEIFYGLQAKL